MGHEMSQKSNYCVCYVKLQGISSKWLSASPPLAQPLSIQLFWHLYKMAFLEKTSFLDLMLCLNSKYSWPLNNMGLSLLGPLIRGFCICRFCICNPTLIENIVFAGCKTSRYRGSTFPIHEFHRANWGTWAYSDFGIHRQSWNQSPVDTKGWLYMETILGHQ